MKTIKKLNKNFTKKLTRVCLKNIELVSYGLTKSERLTVYDHSILFTLEENVFVAEYKKFLIVVEQKTEDKFLLWYEPLEIKNKISKYLKINVLKELIEFGLGFNSYEKIIESKSSWYKIFFYNKYSIKAYTSNHGKTASTLRRKIRQANKNYYIIHIPFNELKFNDFKNMRSIAEEWFNDLKKGNPLFNWRLYIHTNILEKNLLNHRGLVSFVIRYNDSKTVGYSITEQTSKNLFVEQIRKISDKKCSSHFLHIEILVKWASILGENVIMNFGEVQTTIPTKVDMANYTGLLRIKKKFNPCYTLSMFTVTPKNLYMN